MARKVLSAEAVKELVVEIKSLRRQRKDLLSALRDTADIVEREIWIIVKSQCSPDGKGAFLLSTLDPRAKPDFDRYTKALSAARKAIKKASTT